MKSYSHLCSISLECGTGPFRAPSVGLRLSIALRVPSSAKQGLFTLLELLDDAPLAKPFSEEYFFALAVSATRGEQGQDAFAIGSPTLGRDG